MSQESHVFDDWDMRPEQLEILRGHGCAGPGGFAAPAEDFTQTMDCGARAIAIG